MIYLLLLLFFAKPALAVENPQSGSSAVTATVPDRGQPDIPVLISPENNAIVNSTTPTFIFNPSLGDRPVSHYQLWLDGIKNTDHIPQSYSTITTQPLNALSEGTHTWMIKAIATNGGDRDSTIWSFTIDTTAPLILVTEVAGQTTSLSSLDLSRWQEEVIFTTADRYPLIVGQGEAGANLTISFNNETVSVLIGADRTFRLKPGTALLPGRYTLSVSSSDAAGNSTSLPSFSLIVIVPAAGIITIPLPAPLPDLSFNLPIVIPPSLTTPTIFPIIPAAPETYHSLIWLIIITYLAHIYCLNRFIQRLYLHHYIKKVHFVFLYITILLPTGLLGYLATVEKHWLPLILMVLSIFCLVFEFNLIRSKEIKIEQ